MSYSLLSEDKLLGHELWNIYYYNKIHYCHKLVSLSLTFTGKWLPVTNPLANIVLTRLGCLLLALFSLHVRPGDKSQFVEQNFVLSWSFICNRVHKSHCYEFGHTLLCCISPTLMCNKPTSELKTVMFRNDSFSDEENYGYSIGKLSELISRKLLLL